MSITQNGFSKTKKRKEKYLAKCTLLSKSALNTIYTWLPVTEGKIAFKSNQEVLDNFQQKYSTMQNVIQLWSVAENANN